MLALALSAAVLNASPLSAPDVRACDLDLPRSERSPKLDLTPLVEIAAGTLGGYLVPGVLIPLTVGGVALVARALGFDLAASFDLWVLSWLATSPLGAAAGAWVAGAAKDPDHLRPAWAGIAGAYLGVPVALGVAWLFLSGRSTAVTMDGLLLLSALIAPITSAVLATIGLEAFKTPAFAKVALAPAPGGLSVTVRWSAFSSPRRWWPRA